MSPEKEIVHGVGVISIVYARKLLSEKHPDLEISEMLPHRKKCLIVTYIQLEYSKELSMIVASGDQIDVAMEAPDEFDIKNIETLDKIGKNIFPDSRNGFSVTLPYAANMQDCCIAKIKGRDYDSVAVVDTEIRDAMHLSKGDVFKILKPDYFE